LQFTDDIEESIKKDQGEVVATKESSPQQNLASTTVKTGNKIQAGLELQNYNNE